MFKIGHSAAQSGYTRRGLVEEIKTRERVQTWECINAIAYV